MKNFKYIARNLEGARKEGVKQAVSPNDVLAYLRKEGFTPIYVDEMVAAAPKTRQKTRRKHIKSAELATLCWQLTTMVEGGIPLTTALETVAEDIDNLRLQEILLQILEKIEKGDTLSASLALFPNVFNQFSQSMILAGETGGNLPQALHRLAEYFDNRDKLAKKVKGAMAYPVFVLSFIFLIVIFIMTFIIPRFRIIFEQFSGELPAFTRVFMGFYDMLRHNLLQTTGGVLLLIISLAFTLKTNKGHYLFCKIVLRIPLLGKIITHAFLVTFCRTMSTLLSSGVSLLEIFNILAVMTNNDVIKNAILKSRESAVAGSRISASLSAPGFFPNMITKMIQVGEESGSLSRVLERTANYYERKVDSTISTLIGLLEPIMIVTVGAIVLVVVLALYLPIFTMSNVTG